MYGGFAMTTKPQDPISTAEGLETKLRRTASKASTRSYLEDIGEDVGFESGFDSGVNNGMLKRKRELPPVSNMSSKKPAREETIYSLGAKEEPMEVVPGKCDRVAGDLHGFEQRVGQIHSSVGAILHAEQAVLEGSDKDYEKVKKGTPSLENLSHGQLLVNSVIACDQDWAFTTCRRAGAETAGFRGHAHLMSMQATLRGGAPRSRTDDSGTVQQTIPSHAGWFSWTRIHNLEKQGLPEFFNGKTPCKTPKLYLEYRNVIVKKYGENDKKLILAADVQELLVGLDGKAISRVVEFLDHWGLINYRAFAEFRPLWQSPVLSIDSEVGGLLRALPLENSSLYEFGHPRILICNQGCLNFNSAAVASVKLLPLPERPESEYHCNSCAVDCSKQRYHYQEQADFDVCCDCYDDGKFGPGMVSIDFRRTDCTGEESGNDVGWTDHETLLLLEALEVFGDNWNEISEHVATKSKSQCILHFIRLPVEDPFLEDMETSGATLPVPSPPLVLQSANAREGKALEINAHAPSARPGLEVSRDLLGPASSFSAFTDAPNPVMAQVAFLAAMVGPRVAAAAAQAALATLTQKVPGLWLATTAAVPMARTRGAPPSFGQFPARVLPAVSEARKASDGSQHSTAEAGSVDRTAVSGQESPLVFEYEISSRLSSGRTSALETQENVKLNRTEEVLSAAFVKLAAASAMAAASVKAKLLADQEELEIQRLVTTVIEHQLKKLELKLKTFNDLELMLSKECESVERAQQKIYLENARMVVGTPPAGSPGRVSIGADKQVEQRSACGYTPAGQANIQMHAPGSASSFLRMSSLGSVQLGVQGLTSFMTAGAMSTPRGQYRRQGMVTPQQLVGRAAMPLGTPQTPLTIGVPIPGRPLAVPPRILRPAPVGKSGAGPY